MNKRAKFSPKPVAQAIGAFVALLAASSGVQAGPGLGDAYDLNNNPFVIQSYFASSPSGARLWVDSAGAPAPLDGAPGAYDPANQTAYAKAVTALYPNGYPGTGKALRKFVDTLPLPLGHPLASGFGNKATLTNFPAEAKFIPVAQPSKWINPEGKPTTDDYYEIAVVEYAERFHSDLIKPTTLRGYVQIDHEASNGRTALPGSAKFPLKYPDGTPIKINGTDAKGKLTGAQVDALAVQAPHYLGPIISSTRNTPTRVKFLNLLPVGQAVTAAGTRKVFNPTTGFYDDVPWTTVTKRNGDQFIPVDPSIQGAGYGPDGIHTYTQNRVNIHLHGGDNPWISDGTPHQWITPAGESDPSATGSLASLTSANTDPLDPSLLPNFLRGVGAVNVPDMNDPGPGAMTYYFPNGQSARMEWYHDHSVGITRINVYSGIASAYMLTDAVEQDLIERKVIPGPDDTIPLILQDKTFVPNDILFQDANWDTAAWGAPGDLWFPHVYETVQDPNQATNFNSVGRWHWGPWFWPAFPSMYNLPSGSYGDVTTTPEAWNDTPVINGVAYPTITVEPKPYRLRVLNASNDRSFTFNLFVADSGVQAPVLDDNTGLPLKDSAGKPITRANTEVKMIPVNSWAATGVPACTTPNAFTGLASRSDGTCVPETWSTDVYGHNGGVPDYTTQGPATYQIASEGGWLPGIAVKEPQPLSFLLDKGRAAVLNVDWGATGLHLGNGERADLVIDFSAYAGKTLLVYNDNGAPVPAADPRNEYFTGYGDNSATGGAEDTRPGYGPNSRTMMQIVVAPTASGTVTPLDPAALDSEIKLAYKADQETPVVAQSAYNAALGKGWTDNQSFANIYVGSLKQPSFNFVPGTEGAVFNSILMQSQGSGYITPPAVSIAGGGGTGAQAVASLKIDKLHIVNAGDGYRVAPIVTITSANKGSGAVSTATLKVGSVQVTNGGTGYGRGTTSVDSATVTNGGAYTPGITSIAVNTTNRYPGTQVPNVTVAAPTGAGGVRATAVAVMAGAGAARTISSITVTNPGSGYAATPVVSIDVPTGGTAAQRVQAVGTATRGIQNPTVTFPAPAGGVAATGTVTMNGSSATSRAVSSITITNPGSGYTTAPTPTFVGGTVSAAPTATSTLGTAAPVITFARPLGIDPLTGKAGRTATGTAIVSASHAITGVNITDAGSGYTVAPTVTATGGGGTGAKLTTTGALGGLSLDVLDPNYPGTAGGGGYDDLSTAASDPTNLNPGLIVTLTAPPAGANSVTPTVGASGKVFDITMTGSGKNYTSVPTVSVAAPTGNAILEGLAANPLVRSTATAAADTAINAAKPQGSILVKTKAIQELFDPTYGRLNATFGVEIPYTSALTQTTIPLGYVDAPTEEFSDGETQIWKITHNGVDTHPIHFHLLNVQLINRVGWDNFVTPPEPNELGWKETIKMSPLEDVIVAVRAKKPTLGGFGLPNSVRLLDPSQPEGAMSGFTQIDANTGLPATMVNAVQNFGWEYVWHCHILGHEENDFMRPWVFHANEAIPLAASGLAAAQKAASIDLSWVDNASTEYQYRVERSLTTGTPVWAPIGTALANATTYSDPVTGSYQYRVVAVGASGEAVSNVARAVVLPTAPGNLSATRTAGAVRLTWVDSANEQRYQVLRRLAGSTNAFAALTSNLAANSTSYTDNNNVTNTQAYEYQVVAVGASGNASSTITVAAMALPAAPSNLVATRTTGAGGITFTWTDNATDETSYVFTQGNGNTATGCNNLGANAVTCSITNAGANSYSVAARNAVGTSAAATVSVPALAVPGVPTGVTATAVAGATVGSGTRSINVSWTAPTNSLVSAYDVQYCTTLAGNNCTTAGNNVTGTSFTITGRLRSTTYYIQVRGVNASATNNGNGTYSSPRVTVTTAP